MGRFPQRRPIVLLDAAHGGSQRGAAANGHEEAVVTLEMATITADLLTGMCDVAMTRGDDSDVSHKQRRAMSLSADIVLSFHAHADRDYRKNHTEVWCREPDIDAKEFAYILRDRLDSAGMVVMWKPKHNIQLLNGPKPGVAVVGGYLSNPQTAEATTTGHFQRGVAEAAFQAVTAYFRL